MTHYNVISPEISGVIDIGLDDGTGPLEYFCCYVSVDAKNEREAKQIAIKHPDMQKWVDQQRSDGVNPFAGLTVEIPICSHGVCWCDNCVDEYSDGIPCQLCYDEMENEDLA